MENNAFRDFEASADVISNYFFKSILALCSLNFYIYLIEISSFIG